MFAVFFWVQEADGFEVPLDEIPYVVRLALSPPTPCLDSSRSTEAP